jgi:glycosyltransferase involved in cell wall biosynthesis
VFLLLSETLDPHKYQIVLVGTNDTVDKQLPAGILSIHRTQNQQELAEIYSAADLLLNPTREDNYPTVNMESLACGTPVLTFRTGGSPEMLDETCGSVVECDDVDAMEKEIVRICTDKSYSKEACVRKSEEFDQNQRFKEYVNLYERIIAERNQGN